MKYDTPALEKFRGWCDQYTYERAADILSVGVLHITPAAIGNWYAGIRRPRPVWRRRLEIISGIPAKDWLTEEERELLEEAERTEVPAPRNRS